MCQGAPGARPNDSRIPDSSSCQTAKIIATVSVFVSDGAAELSPGWHLEDKTYVPGYRTFLTVHEKATNITWHPPEVKIKININISAAWLTTLHSKAAHRQLPAS